MIQAITIEREFGCGASEIASLVASRLGWSLWDDRLTQEIARLTESTREAVERREWRTDPAVYRIFKDFLRGGFEGGLPPTNRLHLLDARRIAEVSEIAVKTALSSGPSVIVGRGSQFFLRSRKDVFRVFLYSSRDHKIRRLISRGASQDEAIEQIDTTDKARVAFVRQYLGLKWPEPHLYHTMFNTEMGESCTATMLVECVRQFERDTE
ncbi:cytidylate kinase-like family protein [Alloacidobacterium dinghuense]|uniref:Cytidylate kinase-like family protein n=1 Tax=Alloacidobacterium dinghuense TaxID=2763107 RepID=A0A7G8BD76_9BACT|nr:cytidylate kinase-like family protein [Alloacidobacterium dinghuense]QNI30496.1 cytidylate kinase-like family protein [Alloacidobacterium dinghuense]